MNAKLGCISEFFLQRKHHKLSKGLVILSITGYLLLSQTIQTNKIRSYGSKLIGKTSPECPEHCPTQLAQLSVTISVTLVWQRVGLGVWGSTYFSWLGYCPYFLYTIISNLLDPWSRTESIIQGFIEPPFVKRGMYKIAQTHLWEINLPTLPNTAVHAVAFEAMMHFHNLFISI